MLQALYTPKYERDVKALVKKHYNIAPLGEVVDLILEDTRGIQAHTAATP